MKLNIEKLIFARLRSVMTTRELSKASGVSTSTINKIEKGYVVPNPITISKLAVALNIPIEELLKLK
jgi:transcriptional regulator with XRE-family HTH domain